MLIQTAIRELLIQIGENHHRTGLLGTPERVERMYKEIFRGYDDKQTPKVTIFPNGDDGVSVDEMIVDTGKFYSVCEHHMMPFFGEYTFAYIPHPKGNVLGLSKVARIVGHYSARLQIQERLTEQVLNHLYSKLITDDRYPPLGIGLVMKATHLCKVMRGVKNEGVMTTTKLKGMLKADIKARNEFLNHIR